MTARTTKSQGRQFPAKFGRLTHADARVRDIVDVTCGDEDAFDELWQIAISGSKFCGQYPRNFRLWVRPGGAPIADYPVCSRIPMVVLSDRLIECIRSLVTNDAEVHPLPVFEIGSERKITGYSFLHVTRIVDCIRPADSGPRSFRNGEVYTYAHPVLDEQKIEDAAVFKYLMPHGGGSAEVVFAARTINALAGHGFTGIGFLPIPRPDSCNI